MKIVGKLYNATDGSPVAYANIYVSDAKGNILPTQKGTASDGDGRFVLDGADPFGYITISELLIGKDIVSVASIPVAGGTATYNKTYDTKSNPIGTVTIKPKPTDPKNVDLTGQPKIKKAGAPKWILPVVLGTAVLAASVFAIKKWG